MNTKKILDDVVGDFRIKLEEDKRDPGLHDYGIPRQAWKLGALSFMEHFGAEQAFALIDQRANRAGDRGNYETARRWRTLITAIHAIQEDEHLPGDNTH